MNTRTIKIGSMTLICLLAVAELEHIGLPLHAETGHQAGDTVPKEKAFTAVSTSSGAEFRQGLVATIQDLDLQSFKVSRFRSL